MSVKEQLKYLDFDETYWAVDIETEKLDDPQTIWCVCYENMITAEKGELLNVEDIAAWFAANPQAKFVGHNFLKFDAPVLNRIVGTRLGLNRLVDTLVLSNLYNPALIGGHGLDAWGQRLGSAKIAHNEWNRFSQEMLERCRQDVALTKLLYTKLAGVLKKIEFSEKSCELQHKMTSIIRKQHLNGFAFNYLEGLALRAQLLVEMEQLKDKIYVKFPPQLVAVKHFKAAYKKDGSHTSKYLEHSEHYPRLEITPEGGYSAFDWVDFNLASPAQRVEKLLALGWEPEEFTPKTDKGGGGNPRPTIKGELSPSLERFATSSGIEEVELIAQWMALNGRATMVRTWLNEYNENTGCIHGQLWPAQTLRWRHDHPNTANIPAVRFDETDKAHPKPILGRAGFYTYEARSLWIPRAAGRRLVGTDASSLEYRMLAHHVGNDKLIEVVCSSDVHQFTADMAGVNRAGGKTLNFAIIYGAGDAKAGSIVGGKSAAGKELKEKLFANIPGLGEAIEEAKAEFDRGRISLVDGSRIICPAKHAAFNYKLQGGGARVMFQAAVFLEQYIRKQGLDSLKVGDIHDEWQYDVAEKDAEEHARLAVQAMVEAGEELNLRCPMDGKSIIGNNWAETH